MRPAYVGAMSKQSKKAPLTQQVNALRKRAKMSMGETAKALGYKGASGYQRYEDPDLYTKDVLPLHLVWKLVNVWAGKGSPPITREEILMLAGLTGLTEPQARALDEHAAIWCIGDVAAGVWRDSFEWPRDEWLPIIMALHDTRFPGALRQALRVRGDSMDLLYPDGSFIIFVRLGDLGRKPQPGDRLIVLRHQHGGTEATVKEYVRDANKRRWLVPRSSNPAHRPISLDNVEAGVEIDVMGLVVGSQRVE